MTGMTRTAALDENELVELFRSTGENRYFEGLYRLTRRQVFGICLKLLRDPTQAEDITHEAFLRAYERFPTLEGNHFGGWISRIAKNMCLNTIRNTVKRSRILEQSTVSPFPSRPSPAEKAILAQEIQVAKEVLGSLRSEQRTVLVMKYLDGYSYQEIESITGFDAGRIRSYLQNARRNFQIRWQDRISREAER